MPFANWFDLPYNHCGTWKQVIISVMDPNGKVTWPQFIVELVIVSRRKFIPKYRDIKLGRGWSREISGEVRKLVQQATVLCNYFEHPDKDPLVRAAFLKYFREHTPMKIGQYRKTRYKMLGNGRKVCTITQDEKDIVNGIYAEFEKLSSLRGNPVSQDASAKYHLSNIPKTGPVKFKTLVPGQKPSLIGTLRQEPSDTNE